MITIEFYRYIPTLETVLDADGIYKNIFIKSYDHAVMKPEDQLDLSRARAVVSSWLENHYGFCIITSQNQEDVDKEIRIKICNHKRMIKELHEKGMEVVINNIRAK